MKIFTSSRLYSETPQAIFACFAPERLARWWGPAGFSNTFKIFEFKQNGRWHFTMHGPDGTNYENENCFLEIIPAQKVTIQHVNEPHFMLTITLIPTPQGTKLEWHQAIENDEFAAKVLEMITKANAENLERLAQELLRGKV